MDLAVKSSVFNRPSWVSTVKTSYFVHRTRCSSFPIKISSEINHYPWVLTAGASKHGSFEVLGRSRVVKRVNGELGCGEDGVLSPNLGKVKVLIKVGVVLGAMVCGVLVFGCKRVFAVESAVNAGYGVIGQSILLLKNSWPKLSQLLVVFKEQGLILAALLGLSAFFSMAETSITTLWPWKVCSVVDAYCFCHYF